jgi:RNase H-fold protein (predicted Holliday junction resolvase)
MFEDNEMQIETPLKTKREEIFREMDFQLIHSVMQPSTIRTITISTPKRRQYKHTEIEISDIRQTNLHD